MRRRTKRRLAVILKVGAMAAMLQLVFAEMRAAVKVAADWVRK